MEAGFDTRLFEQMSSSLRERLNLETDADNNLE